MDSRQRPTSKPRYFLFLAAGLLSASLFPGTVAAATLNCPTGDVPCLIAAIDVANANPDPDTINLEAGTYTLSTPAGGGPFEPNGLPVISSPITIQGAGAGATIVHRDAALDLQVPVLIFRVLQVSLSGTLTLDSLSVRNGHTEEGSGGGILNFGTLTIVDTDVMHNGTELGSGGGISNAGTLHLSGSLVANNGASTAGGISNDGTMTIDRSSIRDNGAENTGGIRNTGTATITNSAVASNQGSFFGGGIANQGGTLTLTSTTVALNRGGFEVGFGGGIGNDGGGTIHINNSTIADNAIPDNGGAGIENDSGTVELQNSILARNAMSFPIIPFPPGPDCVGVITSLGHNLIEDPSDCSISLLGTDRTGNPGLGFFKDDGTPGNGHIPLIVGSQSIDGGDPASCTPTDQLGRVRADGDGNGEVVCDMGAVEFANEEPIVSNLVSLTSLSTLPFEPDPTGGLTVRASFVNTSPTPIHAPVFVVTELSNGNLLSNSDDPSGAVDSVLTPDVGSDRVLSPGESFDVEFDILFAEKKPFTFFVDLLGSEGP
jgi:hypothetical protein